MRSSALEKTTDPFFGGRYHWHWWPFRAYFWING